MVVNEYWKNDNWTWDGDWKYLIISCSRSSSCFWRIITDSMMARSSGVRWDRSGPPSSILALFRHHTRRQSYPLDDSPKYSITKQSIMVLTAAKTQHAADWETPGSRLTVQRPISQDIFQHYRDAYVFPSRFSPCWDCVDRSPAKYHSYNYPFIHF